MKTRDWCSVWKAGLIVAVLALAVAFPASAQVVKEVRSDLDNLAFSSPELWTTAQGQELNQLRSERASLAVLSVLEGYDAFLTETGGTWRMVFDRVTGNAMLLEGSGLPWIPGTANGLTGKSLGLQENLSGDQVPLGVVVRKALKFIKTHPGLFGVDVKDLVLNRVASGPIGGYLYNVEFGVTKDGVLVEGAHVFFRINHGNLVQFGQENLCASLAQVDTRPNLTLETAWQNVAGYIGGIFPSDEVFEAGRLVILPISTDTALSGASVEPGTGMAYRLVYVLSFHRPGTMGTWEARVDAQTGQLLAFMDANDYGSVHGGSYTGDRPAPEMNVPFPFADIGGGLFTDAGGLFTGNNATSSLAGRYVKIVDVGCGADGFYGAISNTTDWGNLDFGSGVGTDCVTPGVGGTGNTHAARTQYYQVNLIKMKARMYLPANAWLQGQVVDNVNLPQTCNAYWNGAFLNFFKSGGGCGNTGELPGVSLHEWGHGMDSNDGQAPSDKGTGETYGDTTALLQTHTSCLGGGFFLSGNCSGYGDPCSACSGIRDVDYAKHASNTPATTLVFIKNFCPTSSTYKGPCGREGHCESYVSTEANYDLAVRKLTAAPYTMDQPTAWQTIDRLWYMSRSLATGAFSCSTTTFVGSGCTPAGSLYNVYRTVDDDDGNLANGTPHAAAIFSAFNDHGIACGAAGDATNQDSSACPAIAAPALSGTPGDNQSSLSWAAVTNAVTYLVFRNEVSCSAGYMQIGSVAAPATSYVDTTAVNGMTYYYRVQAIGATAACFGPFSNCVTVSPVANSAGTLSGTVTSTAGGTPIAGATLRAVSGGNIYQATSNGSGAYAFASIPAGSYSVTASAYGFASSTAGAVSVSAGGTTTQDFGLAPLNARTVSGIVSDANYGWPLYAKIAISAPGFAGTTLWSDAITGAYSISLYGGTTYTFTATAYVAGYLPRTLGVPVPAGSDLTQNVAILRDPIACIAPGYAGTATPLWTETFDVATTPPALPAGWAQGAIYTPPGSTVPAWTTRAGMQYPSGAAHSAPNVVRFNSYTAYYDASARLYRTTGIDLSAATEPSLYFWMNHDTAASVLYAEHLQVQVSTDAGATWQNVGNPVYRYDGSAGWKRHSVQLAGFTGPLTDVRIGFQGYSGYGNDLNVDDVQIASLVCTAPSGGLVVGHVYDQPTHTAMANATVTNGTTGGSVSTDANGYFTIFAATGSNSLSATKAGGLGIGWGTDPATITIAAGQTLTHDFNVPANHVAPSPASPFRAVVQGTTRTGTLNLANDGNNGAATFTLQDWPRGFVAPPVAPPAQPAQSLEEMLASAQSAPAYTDEDVAACDTGLPTVAHRTEAAPWTSIASLPATAQDASAAVYNGKVYVAGGQNTTSTRTNAFRVYDPGTNSWAALTSLPAVRSLSAAVVIGSKFYMMGGSTGTTDNALLITDLAVAPNVWTTGPTMPAARNSGAAAVLDGKIYFVGGRDGASVQSTSMFVFDPAAGPSGTWSTGTPLPAALIFPSVGVIERKIYVAGGVATGSAYSFKTYVFDPCKNNWTTVADMPGAVWGATYGVSDGKLYVASGAIGGSIYSPCPAWVYDPATNAWSTIASPGTVLYRGASACGLYRIGGSNGSAPQAACEVYPGLANCSSVDATWLSEAPASGSIAQGASQPVTLTYDATAASLGTYSAIVEVCDNTPYATTKVPVSMRVVQPISVTISSTPVPGVESYPVAFSCTVSGGTGTYVSYAWDFGDAGTGTGAAPSHAYAAIGSFTVTLTVTDDDGLTGSNTYGVTIVCPTFTILPAALPPAVVGLPYNVQLTASGTLAACTFSVTGGAKPAWMNVAASGLITGTPTDTNGYSFTITATDAAGCTATIDYTIAAANLFFRDDMGRSQVCINAKSGAYIWQILSGGVVTTTYTGTANIVNGGAKIISKVGALDLLNITYDALKKKASGYFQPKGGAFSALADSNTANNTGGCS